jgi:hypothetical protein
MPDESKKKLTVKDPVPKEVLVVLEQLAKARGSLADQLLEMEQRRITFLAAAKRVEDQRKAVFEEILTSRGLAPGTPVNISSSTGEITLTSPPEGGHPEETSSEETPSEKTR